MTIQPGSRLGPYEVVSAIGAGGMGEVYRGRDTRLDRSVAIKILPAGFAQNEQIRLRFEREARTISQLNHPNICTLFDVGQENGTDYLVMELIEGESLADRIAKGPLSAEQVLKTGAQIAEALDRAHKQGITHRDLKPGNIMLTKAGAKLLDFGLARSTFAPSSSPRLSVMAATEARPLTEEGTILGTFQYMAPEQLEGNDADARTDIFALGAVLYEMATGRRAFDGKSRTSLIAAIVTSQPPPISSVQQMAPPALDHVVRKCLEKDPDDRWQSAHDVASELRWIVEAGSQAGVVAAPRTLRRKTRESLAWALMILFAAAAAVLGFRALRTEPPQTIRLSLAPPAGMNVTHSAGNVAVSPDGRFIAFVGSDASGRAGLFVRSMSDASARLLPGTTDATFPFWSPDSRSVAFFADAKLKKASLAGTDVDVICDAPDGRGGTWNRKDVIVFAPNVAGTLHRVDAHGGASQPLTRLERGRESAHKMPSFLPDDDHYLYIADTDDKSGTVYVASLSSGKKQQLMTSDRAPVYAEPGYLVYSIGERIVARKFDARNLEFQGPPIRLAERTPSVVNTLDRVASVSSNGILVVAAPLSETTRLAWSDRKGNLTGFLSLPPGIFSFPALSPTGAHAVVSSSEGDQTADLWMIDLQRGTPTRLTFGPGVNRFPIWSPDGTKIVFQSNRTGMTDLYVLSPTGGTAPGVFYSSTAVKWKNPTAWSPDGSVIVFDTVHQETGYDIWVVSMDGKARPYIATKAAERYATLSPDGRWAAYESNETGRTEIFVQSFPRPGTKYQVTTGGGSGVEWSEQNELLFAIPSGEIAAVQVSTKNGIEFGPQQTLFTPPAVTGGDLSRDGQKYLVTVSEESAASQTLTVVLNWAAGLQ